MHLHSIETLPTLADSPQSARPVRVRDFMDVRIWFLVMDASARVQQAWAQWRNILPDVLEKKTVGIPLATRGDSTVDRYSHAFLDGELQVTQPMFVGCGS